MAGGVPHPFPGGLMMTGSLRNTPHNDGLPSYHQVVPHSDSEYASHPSTSMHNRSYSPASAQGWWAAGQEVTCPTVTYRIWTTAAVAQCPRRLTWTAPTHNAQCPSLSAPRPAKTLQTNSSNRSRNGGGLSAKTLK